MPKKNITIYIENEDFQALRKAIFPRSISHEITDLLKRRLAELGGEQTTAPQEPIDYEKLSRDHTKLVREVDRQEKWLKKRGAYEDLLMLAAKLGVTAKDLSRLDEAAPKLLSEWTGIPEDALQFIGLLRNVRVKRKLEEKMSEAIKSGVTSSSII